PDGFQSQTNSGALQPGDMHLAGGTGRVGLPGEGPAAAVLGPPPDTPPLRLTSRELDLLRLSLSQAPSHCLIASSSSRHVARMNFTMRSSGKAVRLNTSCSVLVGSLQPSQ